MDGAPAELPNHEAEADGNCAGEEKGEAPPNLEVGADGNCEGEAKGEAPPNHDEGADCKPWNPLNPALRPTEAPMGVLKNELAP